MKQAPELIGHEDIESYLRQCINNQTLAHAYCLHGPRGIGKTTLIDQLIPDILGCDASRCPDYMLVAPEKGIISMQAIRDLKQWISRTPLQSRKKVVVIQSAELMAEEPQNAFLKSLEEPAPYAHIFLLTSNAGRLLPTILSRTVQLRFGLVPMSEMKKITNDQEMIQMAHGRPGIAKNENLQHDVALMRSLLEHSGPSERVRAWLSQNYSREDAYSSVPALTLVLRERLMQETRPSVRKKIAQRIQTLQSISGSEKRINWHLIIEHILISV